MEHLRCVVERITYQSDGYSVLRAAVKGQTELVTIVGNMPDTHVGSVLSLGGSWKIDPRYGKQFSVVEFEETLPATVYGMEKYLGSGLIKGIGPKYARMIVKAFGQDTLDVIENAPDRLLEVPGIGKKRVDAIKKSWQEQKEIKNIMLFLQGHDVSTAHATKIYKTYGKDSISVVQENPYRLADDIWGIGFKTADQIAAKMGFDKEKYERLRSGLLYSLNRLADDGNCYAGRDQLLHTASELLEVEEPLLSMTLDEMVRTEDVKTELLPERKMVLREEYPPAEDEVLPEQKAIYLPPFYFSEIGIARRLQKIQSTPPSKAVSYLPESGGITYDPIQEDAIRIATASKIMILTGGPGTGKSTTTQGILRQFAASGCSVLLAAPTGRAAKRLAEVTGMEAKTIHRLLEFKPPEGYKHTEESPLAGDVLIVDECSMVDAILFYNLLKAIPDSMRLILVGDVDQLPSVGAGNVLRDLIESGKFPVVRLTKIFRQAAASRIITNAHLINQGDFPDIRNTKGTDFFFMEAEEPEAAARLIVDLVSRRLKNKYGSIAQVLTPMQRGVVGAGTLNIQLQAAVNPGQGGPELHRGGYTYRPGDKVMQIRNNYDKEVFNGDIGTVASIDPEDRILRADFDGRQVEYDVSELDELVLAYACTIHKSQGAEYPIVVMPVMMTHYIMLQRNLIYTGVTRAKKVLVLVGTKKALNYAIRHVTVNQRNTLLAERLQKALATDGYQP